MTSKTLNAHTDCITRIASKAAAKLNIYFIVHNIDHIIR
jgi:hypothetical protein